MDSDNSPGADNQQERPGFAQWVVGFVDGEGCFSVPIFRNRTCRLGWQVQPAFTVVQGERSVSALHLLKQYFDCGQVGRNGRMDNHQESLYRFTVRRLSDLSGIVVPFFEAHPLVTAKSHDFMKFSAIVRMKEQGSHLLEEGLVRIAAIVETMNRRQPSRFLESSEAIRRAPSLKQRDEDMVHAPWRHGESREL